MAQIGELRPDRIALYAYAHLPQRFKPQRRIDGRRAAQRRRNAWHMLGGAIAGFLARGYSYIGMDHFALPDDALAVAKRQGRLHRNFQGYSTQPDCDLIGLGVSAIGKVGATYSQNAKTLPEYYDALHQGQLPVERGLALNRDDLLRRAVIMALMCQGRVEFESIELAHLIDMRDYFAHELERARADWPSRPGGDRTAARSQVTAERLVRGARGGDGVRPRAAERQASRTLLAHHLKRMARQRRLATRPISAECPRWPLPSATSAS